MQRRKCHLSVNVNKIATLRNSRGGDVPNVLQCTKDLVSFGAEGITVHPRPDARHITPQDVMELSQWLTHYNQRARRHIEFNIEGYPSPKYMKLISKVRPDQATLVPDPPHALTSNAGWAVARNEKKLKAIIARLRKLKVRSSIFIDVFTCSKRDLAALEHIRPDRIELYTEKYARDFKTKRRAQTTARYASIAKAVQAMGIAVNAGHDLNSVNLRYLLKNIDEIVECSIGHALISEALYLGFKKTIQTYLREMRF